MRNEAKRLEDQYNEVMDKEKNAKTADNTGDNAKSERNSESDTDQDVSFKCYIFT